MNKVRITGLKATFNAVLAAEYGVAGRKACLMLRVGQEF